jgi:hypothetical protein
MNPCGARTNLLQTIASDWIGRDPNAALDWILSVNDLSLQEQLVAAGSKAYAATDPKLAADWFVSSVQSEAVLNNTLPGIVEIWAAKDPPAAADWVAAQLPDGNIRETAVGIVSNHWQQSDPDAAARWILNLSASDRPEPAVSQ